MKPPIIDAHQHLWDPASFSYSWMEPFPVMRRRAMLEEYRVATEGLGIDRTVYVDTDVDSCDMGRELQTICRLADDPANGIAGIVAGAKMEEVDPFAHFGPLEHHPKIKGVRRVLHTQPDDLSSSPVFVKNVRSLAGRSWTFDLCVLARQLPLALNLVEQCPQVVFVLDHCGNPDIASGSLSEWSGALAQIARHSNVCCKVSGLVVCAGADNASLDNLRPSFERAVEVFGWDRILWGGDWPVCTLASSLADWLDMALALTSSATAEQRNRFFHGNACRIYRLD